eukprot:COSAG02_NODE_16355_length_1090_cov_1.286579_1_plen_91_part_10
MGLLAHHSCLPRADLWRAALHARPAGLGCPESVDLLELALLDLQPRRGTQSRATCLVRRCLLPHSERILTADKFLCAVAVRTAGTALQQRR